MMRFFALVLITALLVAPEALAASQPSGPQSPQRLSVTPKVGGRKTTFRVPFTARLASTNPPQLSGQERVRYSISAVHSGHSSANGCVDNYAGTVSVTKAHERVTGKLDPEAAGRSWCTGHFSGAITELITPACAPIVAGDRRPAGACPQFIVAQPIGTFHFTVR